MADTSGLAYRELVPDNDFIIGTRAEKPSTVAGDRFRKVPDTGLTGLTAFLSLAKGQSATAIHASLSVALTEVSGTGFYMGTILGSAITAQLASYVDTSTPVFLVIRDGTSERDYWECRVVSAKRGRVGA
jgi:hypothetical protein